MMKNTIKNTVSEVYKKVNNNYSFNRDLLNTNNINTTSKNQYKNTNSNKKRIMNTNADILKTNFNKQNNSMYIFLILFLVFLFIIAIGLFFKESIIHFFKELFKNEEDQEKIKQLEDTISKNNALQNDMQNKMLELEKKNSTEKNKKKDKKLNKRISKDLLKDFSPEQFVKNDGYCYIGVDDNMRHCEKVYAGDICQSGDIFNRIDECLVPKNP